MRADEDIFDGAPPLAVGVGISNRRGVPAPNKREKNFNRKTPAAVLS